MCTENEEVYFKIWGQKQGKEIWAMQLAANKNTMIEKQPKIQLSQAVLYCSLDSDLQSVRQMEKKVDRN